MNKELVVRKNVRLGYIISFLIEFYLPVSVWFFFYSRYLSVAQIAFIAGFQMIVWNIMEVPTGAFADVYGRKTSMILAFFLYASCMFIAAFTTQFWIFVLLEVFKGISNALNSGSLEALVYDTLKENKQENRWDRVVSHNESLLWIGLFLASILGGFLFYIWYPLPYIAQGIVYIAAAVLAFGFHEPRVDSLKYSFKKMISQNSKGFKEIFATQEISQKTLVFIILGAGFVTASSILGISQAQEYGLDSRGVGILFGIGYLISAAFSYLYPSMRKRFGSKYLIYIVAIVLVLSFLLAKFVGVILGCVLIIARISSSTTYRNVRSSIFNKIVSSENRATALSSVNLMTQLPYAILAYFIGSYIDKTSPNQFAFVLGVTLLLALGIIHICFYRLNKLRN